MTDDSATGGWLRLGEVVLFSALLALGLFRAVQRGASVWAVVLTVAIAAVFFTGSIFHRRLPDALRVVWLGTLLALQVGLVAVSAEFLWMAFPLWMLAGRAVPLPAGLLATATSLAALITVLRMAGVTDSATVLGPIVGAAVAVGLARAALRLERDAAEQRRLLGEVLAAQSEASELADSLARQQHEAGVLAERARLAHDIHDTLAQGFSSVLLLARAALREPEPGQARSFLEQIEATATDNLSEARRVVYAIAPAAGTLAATLARLGDEASLATGARIEVEVEPGLDSLPTPVEVAILRVVQGALANIRQHSQAQRVRIGLARAGGEVRLDVVDDGVGFDPAGLSPTPTLEGGYGLRAMRERVTRLGGGLDIESEPGGGTAICLHLPIGVVDDARE